MFPVQQIAAWYCLAAVLIFSVQGIVALIGATELIIPDLPSPIPLEYGRAIHLGMAVLWPFLGSMGMVYYFIVEELGRDIFSLKLVRWQFWIILVSILSIFASLALHVGNGREYLDGLPIFYLGICLGLTLGSYNLIRTLLQSRTAEIAPAAAIMTAGIVALLASLLPNTLSFPNPVADEAAKFWVVHLWEEMAFELTTTGFIASFFKTTGLAGKQQIERWLYLEVTFSVVAGFFGTAHHYYWIGFPAYWLLIGTVFSLLELIPVGMLVHMAYKGLKNKLPLSKRQKITLWLVLSSLFYHVTGAALLGYIISIPWVNLYMHGTYLTSGHAHLALFGALGFLVLGGCFFILSKNYEPTPKEYKKFVVSVLFINSGLIIMSFSLLIAGFIQIYLWRFIGQDFMQVQPYLKLYLVLRVIGGSVFTMGDFLLTWSIFKIWRKIKNRRKKLSSIGAVLK
ncbi:MAG: cbb3-type cytochrome c oxidase subunit I [Desulfitobacteriaceae bacterium]